MRTSTPTPSTGWRPFAPTGIACKLALLRFFLLSHRGWLSPVAGACGFFSPLLFFCELEWERKARASGRGALGTFLLRAKRRAVGMSKVKARLWKDELTAGWILVCLLMCGLGVPRVEAVKISKRPMRSRSCVDRPEELLEQLYGRLTAGMFSAFHHTLQLEPLENDQNISCPVGARLATDKKFQLPINLNSVSPWSYRISYDSTRYPKYIPEAYCLCKGCLTGDYREENLHFRSTPVFMPTVILHRTTSCTGGRYAYTEDYVSIPVGCTCVPEHEKETQVNSSRDKRAVKLMGN